MILFVHSLHPCQTTQVMMIFEAFPTSSPEAEMSTYVLLEGASVGPTIVGIVYSHVDPFDKDGSCAPHWL